MTEHSFTQRIREILTEEFDEAKAIVLLAGSDLLKYVNIKTKSANRGSKSRGSFGNLYAIYVLVEDYVNGGFAVSGAYGTYDGAVFSTLFKRQRELPFGSKLQNHALNHRLNKEFERYFPASTHVPIIRDTESQRYWINENLLKVPVGEETLNIAQAVLKIIDAYVDAKQGAFEAFIEDCERMQRLATASPDKVQQFLIALMRPNVDARIFEIVSFAILKAFYKNQRIYWGWSPDELHQEELTLFKTGRTNANDGGIDFVMKPLGRFFQVTETVDVAKYFLDIEKVQRYPITFVIKSNESVKTLQQSLSAQATSRFVAEAIVKKLLGSIEEIINIPALVACTEEVAGRGELPLILNEVVLHSRVEFHQT